MKEFKVRLQLSCRDDVRAGPAEVPRPSVEPLRPQRNAPPEPLPRVSEPWLLVDSSGNTENVPPRATSFLVNPFADTCLPRIPRVLLACICSALVRHLRLASVWISKALHQTSMLAMFSGLGSALGDEHLSCHRHLHGYLAR